MSIFTPDIIAEAKILFPEARDLHFVMQKGDANKALDFVYTKLQFDINEDDIIRAFVNKKELLLLEQAKRAKRIRDLYQKIFACVDKQEAAVASKLGYEDCI